MQNVQGLLKKVMEKSLPASQRMKQKTQETVPISSALEKRFDEWWTTLHQMESQADRVALLQHLIVGDHD